MRVARVWAWVAVVAVSAVGLLAWPWRLNPEAVGETLNTAAPLPAALHWRAPEAAHLRLLPLPTIEIAGLNVVDAAGRLRLDSPNAEFELAMAPLVAGRLAVAALTLSDPHFDFDAGELAAAAKTLAADYRPPIAKLSFANAHLRRSAPQRQPALGPIDGALVWPASGPGVTFSLKTTWRGEAIAVEGAAEAPLAAAAGATSDVRFDLSAAPLKLQFAGRAALGPAMRLSGDLTFAAPSLRQAAAWLDYRAAAALPAIALTLSGPLAAKPGATTLADATFSLGGQKFDGSIDLTRNGERWLASATLASDRLDLDPLIGPPAALIGATSWSQRAAAWPFDPLLDVDLRLSTALATWGALSVSEAQLAMSRRKDSVSFEALDATLAKGALNAEATFSACATVCKAHATLSLANADVEALFRPFGVTNLSGHGALTLELDAEGDNAAALIASARGGASLKAEAGAVGGVNIEEALRRVERGRPAIDRDLGLGRTPFSAARLQLAFDNGRATIIEARMEGPGAAIEASGLIDIGKRTLETDVDAVQADVDGKPSPGAATLSLAVVGPWARPSVRLAAPAP